LVATEGGTTLSPEPSDRTQLRRAVIASTIGTTIEWYDFFLYSTVTGLVFAQLYFPKSDPLVGTLQAFAVYAVGFVARPVGAAIFGHFGDRIGRKSTLIATLHQPGHLAGNTLARCGRVPPDSRIRAGPLRGLQSTVRRRGKRICYYSRSCKGAL
jgi:hypothetical protein